MPKESLSLQVWERVADKRALGDLGLGGLAFVAAQTAAQVTAIAWTMTEAGIIALSVAAISYATDLMPSRHTQSDGTD